MLDTITKVYSGRIGCMCGSNGRYSYTAMGAQEDNPGYDVTDQINERSVKIIAGKLLRDSNTRREENMLVLEKNNRILVAWLAD